MSKDTEENADIPIKGPVFISTVYPVTEFESQLVEIMDPIDNAYNLAGEEIIVSRRDKHHFPAPFSYPFRFSSKGLELIRDRLLSIEVVDPDSIEVRDFPNIPKDEQYLFETDEFEKILINEKYVSFRIKDWKNVRFMKFPTFLVINFDFTQGQIKSFQDYRAVAAFWRKKIGEFNKLEELNKVLGISRQKNKWSFVPIVTFVTLSGYDDENFLNRYFPGGDESINRKRQERFLKEVSLIERSGDLSNWTTILRHFESISHEYSFIFTTMRFYYSQDPLFYEGNAFTNRSSTSKDLSRILRSVLFTNVVLPSSIEQLRLLDKEIKQRFFNIRKERINTFNSFSQRQINDFHSHLNNENDAQESMIETLERIKEAQKGATAVFLYFEDPFRDDPVSQTKNYSSYVEGYRKLFHFEKAFNYNDRKKAEAFLNELNSILDSVEKEKTRYNDEIRSAMELLENRRNLLENRKNTLLAIIIPAGGALIGALIGTGVVAYLYFIQWR